jgi:hypothetical protein
MLATNWPVVPDPGDMGMENLVELWLAGETKVLGENLPNCHFTYIKSHTTWRARTPAIAMGSQRLTASAMAYDRATNCNISAASGAPITIKRKCLKCKKHNVACLMRRDGWKQPFLGPLDLRTLQYVTCTYGDMWKVRHTNIWSYRLFGSFESEFHRPQPMSMSHSCVHGNNSNIALTFAE